MTIDCPKHGHFQQAPDKHLQSRYGCPRCGIDARGGQRLEEGRERFAKQFAARHGGRLELLSPYKHVKESIRVRCRVHAFEWDSTPDLLNTVKFGCPRCDAEAVRVRLTKTQDEFIQQIRAIHGDKVDLSGTVYNGASGTVVVGCGVHAKVTVRVTSLKRERSHGCPICGKSAFGYASARIKYLEETGEQGRPTTIGLMEVEVFGLKSVKLGITTRGLLARYRDDLRAILFEAILPELDALRLEQTLHAEYQSRRDTRIEKAGMRGGARWPGDQELYFASVAKLIRQDLIAAVEALSAGNKDYWSDGYRLPALKRREVDRPKGTYNARKPVVCLNTGEVFPSSTAAALAIGSNQGLVSSVCRGKRGSAKGLRFAYQADIDAGSVPTLVNRQSGPDAARGRAVRCIDTGERFPTITIAARAKGCSVEKIVAVCKGSRRATMGLRWEYVRSDAAPPRTE